MKEISKKRKDFKIFNKNKDKYPSLPRFLINNYSFYYTEKNIIFVNKLITEISINIQLNSFKIVIEILQVLFIYI